MYHLRCGSKPYHLSTGHGRVIPLCFSIMVLKVLYLKPFSESRSNSYWMCSCCRYCNNYVRTSPTLSRHLEISASSVTNRLHHLIFNDSCSNSASSHFVESIMHAYACTHHTHVHIYIHPHIHMQTRHTHTHTHTQTYLFIINFSFCHLSIVKLIPLESVGPRLPEGGGIQTSVSCHWCVLIGDFLLMDQSHS